jgi:hypothetical protein
VWGHGEVALLHDLGDFLPVALINVRQLLLDTVWVELEEAVSHKNIEKAVR